MATPRQPVPLVVPVLRAHQSLRLARAIIGAAGGDGVALPDEKMLAYSTSFVP